MREAAALLRDAESRLDAPLLGTAQATWRGGFSAGAAWMRSAMGEVRDGTAPAGTADFGVLGVAKYAVCVLAAAVPMAVALLAGSWWPCVLVVPAFYAVEAQMVFLFPVALDGAARPFAAARALVRPAGGTLHVMRTVLPIACRMLFGGLAGRGFLRSWCVGGLAVVLWYERVRGSQ